MLSSHMFQPICAWAFLITTALAAAQNASTQDVPAYPSNSSAYQQNMSRNASQTVVLYVSPPLGNPGGKPPTLWPLTNSALTNLPVGSRLESFSLLKAALEIVALALRRATLTSDSPQTDGLGHDLIQVSAQNSDNITTADQELAYISCDAQDYPGSISLQNVTSDAVHAGFVGIIFYSKTEPFCNVGNNATLPSGMFAAYYSMTDQDLSGQLLSKLDGMFSQHIDTALVTTQQAYNDAMNDAQNNNGFPGPSPSTAVAMIVLYSITGVITALFLIIIVTGAIRAHRHPERYGPRNVLGRQRQNRARGLARAMLDSIPIVKFGEKANEPDKPPGDVELANRSSAEHQGTRQSHEQNQDASGAAIASDSRDTTGVVEPRQEGGKDSTSVRRGENSPGDSAAAIPGKKDGSHKPEGELSNAEEGLGCSICTEDFEKGQDLRVLPCDHKFHPACVDPWLLDVSGTCPLCRVDLRPAEARQSSEANREEQDRDTRRQSRRMRGNDRGEGRRNADGEGDEPLPPPLDPDAANRSATTRRRRETLMRFVDPRRLPGMTREQRLTALRRFRQEHTDAEGNPEAGTAGEDRQVNVGRLERVRRTMLFSGNRRSTFRE